MITVRQACIQQVIPYANILGHALSLDITVKSQVLRVINFYRHPKANIRSTHLHTIFDWILGSKLMLVGDFNSITSPTDRVSGNLDPSSMVLQSFLDKSGLTEPGGSKCYTYQHPAIVQ